MSQIIAGYTQRKPHFPEKRKLFFGSYVDALTMPETLETVETIIEDRVPTQHVVINVAKLVIMQKDEKLRDIVNTCSLINADGQGIVWGAKMLGIRIPERVAGIDLFMNLMALADKKKYRVFFLGAHEEVVQKVVEIFSERYPSMVVAGYQNGYFRRENEEQVVEKIRQSEADMLFVAMSSPQKEYFLNKYTEAMQVPFVMGVGGSFDVVAGVTRRAPIWMQRVGLEWLYRIICEPRRMTPRYLSTNTAFFLMMVKALLFGKKKYGCS